MEFPATSMIAVPITKFFFGKCSTVSFSGSCFGVLEVWHVFFRFYYLWCSTQIHNKFFSVRVLFLRFCDKQFVVDYIFCDVVCRLFFGLFLPVEIYFFVIGHVSIITFLLIIFVLVVPWFFIVDNIVSVFLGVSGFVTVVTFWCVCTFSVPAVLWLVPIFPASRAGTLVLGFYVHFISSSLDVLGIDCSFILSKKSKILSQILLIVKGFYSSSNSYSRISMMVWYSSGSLIVCESSFLSYQFVCRVSVGLL